MLHTKFNYACDVIFMLKINYTLAFHGLTVNWLNIVVMEIHDNFLFLLTKTLGQAKTFRYRQTTQRGSSAPCGRKPVRTVRYKCFKDQLLWLNMAFVRMIDQT